MSRTKYHVEYPLAQTLKKAIEFMENGGEVWQECSDDFPNCGGFDDIECLKENFPEEDYKEDEDCQDLSLHLVPAAKEDAEPFIVGETVWAVEEYFPTNEAYMHVGDCYNILKISSDGERIRLDTPKHKEVWYLVDKFCRCVLPVYMEKVYICFDPESSSMGMEHQGVYKDLDFLKQECMSESEVEIIWSDESEDFEETLEELGILNNYSGSNWDIEAIDKATGNLRFGVGQDLLRTQYS